jgi:hypothetical protein
MGLQPGRDGLDVLIRWAKLLAELVRSEPFVEVRRRLVLLRIEERS